MIYGGNWMEFEGNFQIDADFNLQDFDSTKQRIEIIGKHEIISFDLINPQFSPTVVEEEDDEVVYSLKGSYDRIENYTETYYQLEWLLPAENAIDGESKWLLLEGVKTGKYEDIIAPLAKARKNIGEKNVRLVKVTREIVETL